MLRILVLDAAYPHPADDDLGDVFVHVRAREYVRIGHQVKWCDFSGPRELSF